MFLDIAAAKEVLTDPGKHGNLERVDIPYFLEISPWREMQFGAVTIQGRRLQRLTHMHIQLQ